VERRDNCKQVRTISGVCASVCDERPDLCESPRNCSPSRPTSAALTDNETRLAEDPGVMRDRRLALAQRTSERRRGPSLCRWLVLLGARKIGCHRCVDRINGIAPRPRQGPRALIRSRALLE
jgi:hypothetical protein